MSSRQNSARGNSARSGSTPRGTPIRDEPPHRRGAAGAVDQVRAARGRAAVSSPTMSPSGGPAGGRKSAAAGVAGGRNAASSRYNARDRGEMPETPQARSPGQGSVDDSLDDSVDGGSSSQGTHTTATSDIVKSNLPCGISMTFVMVCLIAIPVIFLIVYSALPLSEAQAAADLLANNRGVLDEVIELGRNLQSERRHSSNFLVTTGAAAAENFKMLNTSRGEIDKHILAVTAAMVGSDLETRQLFVSKMNELSNQLASLRKEVDLRSIAGPTARTALLKIVEDVFSSVMWIAGDSRGETFRNFLLLFTMLRRMQNSIGAIGTVGAALIQRDGFDEENYATLQALVLAVRRDIVLINKAGELSHAKEVAQIDRDAQVRLLFEYANQMMTRNYTRWGPNITLVNWIASADKAVNLMAGNHRADMDTQGKLLIGIAVGEGMKMMGALIACCIATVFVIWLNNREQRRLENALIGAHNMSKAVQRFVPRGQLKSMGVRSITQVTRGLATEISQVLMASDCRDFTQLAATMESMELFEWLQSYVERMTSVTNKHNGYVSSVLGDRVNAIFHQCTDGLNASINIHVATDKLNLEIVAGGKRRLVQIGVGLHYGVVVAGVFGDANRLSAVHIASHVSLASNLEVLTTTYGAKVIASEAVIDNINANIFNVRCLGSVQVPGAVDPIMIYDCFDADPLQLKLLKHETVADFEEAVAVGEQDPEGAKPMFDRIAMQARTRLLRDVAAEKKGSGNIVTPRESQLDPNSGRNSARNSASGAAAPAPGFGDIPAVNSRDVDSPKQQTRR